MATTSAVKVCRLCNKDVSNAKRIKDAAGRYYCEPCHRAAVQQQGAGGAVIGTTPAAAAVRMPARPVAVANSTPPTSKPEARAAAPVAAQNIGAPTVAAGEAAKGPKPLPKFCPNCNAPVLPNRKLCIKCQRDVTQMDLVIKMKEEAAKGPNTDEVIATWISRVVRVALIVVVVGIAVFIGWGIYLQFAPSEPFDEYPKSREALIREWLGDIAQGTDKSYGKAYLLTSFRERITGNDRTEQSYKPVFTRIHDEFGQKYGQDWLGKVQIVNLNPASVDETTHFEVVIGEDHHPADVQVQISVEQAVANGTVRRDKPKYPENGKWHFGMVGLKEYQINGMSGMEEQFGRGKPDLLPEVPAPDKAPGQ